MSHHYSGPQYGFPHGDARLDLTDLYAFSKPGDTGKSILIMNVHPSVSVNPPGPTTREPFATQAVYELKVDTNGDAVADIAYRVSFARSSDGEQLGTVRRGEGRDAAGTSGEWVQADRGARPSQSIFLTGEQQAAYLAGEPVDDARFVGTFAHSLEHTGGYSPEEARRTAETLLPDILVYSPGLPASYPAN